MIQVQRSFWALGLTLLAILTGCSDKNPPDEGFTAVGPTGVTVPGRNNSQGAGDRVSDTALVGVSDVGGDVLQPRDATAEGDDLLANANLYGAVYFEFDKSFIRPADFALLDDVANQLTTSPDKELIIVGHCDWRGTTEYNMALGDRRGNAVKEHLVTLGISASRIEVISKGDLEAANEAGEDQMSKDRRADVYVRD